MGIQTVNHWSHTSQTSAWPWMMIVRSGIPTSSEIRPSWRNCKDLPAGLQHLVDGTLQWLSGATWSLWASYFGERRDNPQIWTIVQNSAWILLLSRVPETAGGPSQSSRVTLQAETLTAYSSLYHLILLMHTKSYKYSFFSTHMQYNIGILWT